MCASVDKLDKEPWEKVEKELIDERGLTPDAAARLGSFVRFRGSRQNINSNLIKDAKYSLLFIRREIESVNSELNPDLDNVAVLDQMMLIPDLAANAKFKKGVEEIKVRFGFASSILGFLMLTFLSLFFLLASADILHCLRCV